MEQTLIKKDMTIGDVVQKYPHLSETLTANGVHCVGCGARFFETLEAGFKGHGMTDEQVDNLIGQLNAEVTKAPPVKAEVVVTEAAAKKLKDILKQEGKENYGLRIQVIPGEAGNQYGIDFDEKPNDNDSVLEQHGLKLFVASDVASSVNGAHIDYVEEGDSPGFRISNLGDKSGYGSG